ncbi:LYR motif-containing protein 2 isoform X1 [Petromyzon marinus]|uniref:LYR motif-containing protein 2 isoform X1 n=1 Tax=Petromyzon marinus TaxID=7757 RepID=UPI003F6FA1D1
MKASPHFGRHLRPWRPEEPPHEFLHRQRVLSLYRKILRAIRQVPDRHYQVYLQESARHEFKMNREEKNEDAVRMAMTRGNAQLKELQKIIRLSK